MNRIERAVTAAVESGAVAAVPATAPIATAVTANTYVSMVYVEAVHVGGTQRPIREYLQQVGDVEGMSAADLLRSRRAALEPVPSPRGPRRSGRRGPRRFPRSSLPPPLRPAPFPVAVRLLLPYPLLSPSGYRPVRPPRLVFLLLDPVNSVDVAPVPRGISSSMSARTAGPEKGKRP